MGYVRGQKKRKKHMRKWVRKFIKWGLVIAFVAFLVWWLLHMIGDLQGTIIGLEDQINKQNIELNHMQKQLQEVIQENHQLKVKINGISEYIVDQNNVIQDVPSQPELENPNTIEQPNDFMKHRDSLAISSLMSALVLLGRLAIPILKFGAF